MQFRLKLLQNEAQVIATLEITSLYQLYFIELNNKILPYQV